MPSFPSSQGSHHYVFIIIINVISHYVVLSIRGVKKNKGWMFDVGGEYGLASEGIWKQVEKMGKQN